MTFGPGPQDGGGEQAQTQRGADEHGWRDPAAPELGPSASINVVASTSPGRTAGGMTGAFKPMVAGSGPAWPGTFQTTSPTAIPVATSMTKTHSTGSGNRVVADSPGEGEAREPQPAAQGEAQVGCRGRGALPSAGPLTASTAGHASPVPVRSASAAPSARTPRRIPYAP